MILSFNQLPVKCSKAVIIVMTGGRPVYVSNGSHILSYRKDEARVDVVYGKVG